MVQLRSCYFCGTTGELSEYAALPPALRVDEASTPRVVLCNRCHTKLANVLAPLADRVGREGGRVDDTASGQSSAVRSQATDDHGDAGAETASNAAEPSSSQPEVTFSEPVGDAAAAESEDGGPTVTSADEDEEANAEAVDNGETDEDGESDASGEAPARTVDAHDDAAPDDNDAADPDSAADSDTDPADDEEDAPAAADTAPPTTNLDRVYHKLLRFLRNREFPLPRAEAEAIAQSAYDLTATEAAEVIQRTVDRGVLEERDGELHRR